MSIENLRGQDLVKAVRTAEVTHYDIATGCLHNKPEDFWNIKSKAFINLGLAMRREQVLYLIEDGILEYSDFVAEEPDGSRSPIKQAYELWVESNKFYLTAHEES